MKQVIILLLLVANCAKAQLQSGPMLGHIDLRDAKIWAQSAQTGVLQLQYRSFNSATWLDGSAINTKEESARTAIFTIGNLNPGTKYQYRLLFNGKPVLGTDTLYFSTQSLWQHRTDPPAFKVALGSCTYINEERFDRPGKPYGGEYQIFNTIVSKQPDLMLWLGDNIYLREPDWSSLSGIQHRYAHTRGILEMQRLLRFCPHYATWDDHDYGPNDATKSWIHKSSSRLAFTQFWANPTYGTPELMGITTAFRHNDIDFFLLDDRWYRTSERLADSCSREMLGHDQIEWLIDALKYSNAPYKIVANGSQILNTEALYENYAQYQCERERLLDRIAAEGIKNVVFVSGDRHHSEISRVSHKGTVIHDVTSSPLTSSVGRSRENEINKNRIPGSLFLERSFAVLEFSGERKARQLNVVFYNNAGVELFRYSIPSL